MAARSRGTGRRAFGELPEDVPQACLGAAGTRRKDGDGVLELGVDAGEVVAEILHRADRHERASRRAGHGEVSVEVLAPGAAVAIFLLEPGRNRTGASLGD